MVTDATRGEEMKINFHQHPHKNERRYWRFVLRQGNLVPFLINRFKWHFYPRLSIVSKFPLHVDIEVTNKCNMNCPMCFRKNIRGDQGYMEWEAFTKIVDECARNNVFSIRLSWRGESLTHPDIKDIVRYATRKIKNVSFVTNAFYLNKEMSEHLIDCQLSYVSASFDGIGDIYNQVRFPAKYEESYAKLKYLQEAKEKRKTKKPQLRVTTLWPAISGNPQEYYDVMSKVVDYIAVNNYKNFFTSPSQLMTRRSHGY